MGYFSSADSGGGGGYFGGSGTAKPKLPPNVSRQLASELSRAQATLSKFDKKKAAKLGDLVKRYGAEIPPEELKRSGLITKPNAVENVANQIGHYAAGPVRVLGSLLGRAQQTVYGAINPDKGDNILEGAVEGARGKRVQTLSETLGKEAPTSGPLLGLRRALFKTADFTGGVATDPLTYVTLGTSAAAKTGLTQAAKVAGRELGEEAGRETVKQIAKKGLRSVEPGLRTKIEAEITQNVGKSAARTVEAIEKGASKARLLGQDLGYHGLPRRSEEILGHVGVSGRAAEEAGRAAIESGAKSRLAQAKDTLAQAKAASTEPTQGSLGLGGVEAGPVTRRFGAVDEAAARLASPETSIKAARAEVSAARSALKEITKITGPSRELAATAAEAAANAGLKEGGLRRSLRESFIPRGALRNTAERQVFSNTASAVQGVTREELSKAALTLKEAVPKGFTHADDVATTKTVTDAILDLGSGKVTKAGTTQTTISGAAIAERLTTLADEIPEIGGIIKGLIGPTVKQGVKKEAIERASSIGDLFEILVGSPIRSQSQGILKKSLEAKGLSTLRTDVGKQVGQWADVHINPLDQATNPSFLTKSGSLFRRTAIRTPGFVVKNATGDYLNIAAETLSHQYGASSAARVVRDAWKAAGALDVPAAQLEQKIGKRAADYLIEARKIDITGSDVFATEATKGTISTTKRKFSPLRLFNPVAKAGSRLSEHARLTLYMAEREAGSSIEQAADAVRKTLGDYSDYTPFERATIRNHISPFYKYHRNNTPFQIAKLVTSPKIAAAEYQAQRALGTGEKPLDVMPFEIPNSLAVPLGGKNFLRSNTGLQAALSDITPAVQGVANAVGMLPGAERSGIVRDLQPEGGFGEVGKGVLGQLGGPNLTGLFKELEQWRQGEDFFTGAPITDRNILRHALGSMLPEMNRAMRMSSASGEDWPKILMSTLAGISVLNAGDAKQRSEIYRRLDILRKLISDAETDGKSAGLLKGTLQTTGLTDTTREKLPTLTDLRKDGTLPDPNKKKGGYFS